MTTSGSEAHAQEVWTSLAISLIGKSHLRASRPNQDSAFAWVVGNGAPVFAGAAASQTLSNDATSAFVSMSTEARLRGLPILAVSDGHGGGSYDRSDIGSSQAVVLAAIAVGFAGREALAERALSMTWTTEWTRRLVQQWRNVVLGDQDFEDSRDAQDHVTRYGATLIGAAVDARSGLCFQLGDGDLVVVDTDFNVHRPTPPVAEMLGSETESLCQEDAEYRIRVAKTTFAPEEVLMVMLASDGVSNSFVEDGAFEDFARDIAERTTTMTQEMLRAQLYRWLASCTSFSGDDVSMAIAVRHAGDQTTGAEELEG